jgi:hypothetical protein
VRQLERPLDPRILKVSNEAGRPILGLDSRKTAMRSLSEITPSELVLIGSTGAAHPQRTMMDKKVTAMLAT